MLVPVRIDPTTADRDTWSRFHEIRRLRREELWPERPLRPDEIVEASMKRPDPSELHFWYEISESEVALSSFAGGSVKPENPEYETNKHLFWVVIYVRPERRRRGIATSWLNLISRLMDERGATVLGMSTDNEPGHAFLKWLGAEPKLTDVDSRLDLSQVDWAMVERWVKEGQDRSPETRLEIYDGKLPKELVPDFAAQRTALLNTMPFENLDLGKIIVTPEKVAEWEERAQLTQTVWHNVMTRQADGTITGMTDVEWTPYGPRQIQQQFTGVLPAARGRGIGKWIKAAMLMHLRELYPEAQWIVTDNAQTNAPMLKINRDLGFKPFRTSVDYQMSRAELEAKLKTL